MPLGHGQLRRRRPGRPGPHRQAQAEEDPVPAPSDRRLPRRDRPDHRTLVTTCSTSSTWLGRGLATYDRRVSREKRLTVVLLLNLLPISAPALTRPVAHSLGALAAGAHS